MMTWTATDPASRWSAVVTADSVDLALTLLTMELAQHDISQVLHREQLIPMPTTSRKARVVLAQNGG